MESVFEIADIKKETEDISSIILNGTINDNFKKRFAGQFLSIRFKNDEAFQKPHPFTISNAPDDDCLQISVKKRGAFTSNLHNALPGSEVLVSGPYGTFCKEIESFSQIVMIAGGIGITPFLSVLRHFYKMGIKKDLTLFWANNNRKDFFALNDMELWIQSKIVKTIFVTLNEEKDTAGSGLIFENGYLSKDIIMRYTNPSSSHFYICGSSGMQDFVIENLKTLGVNNDFIKTEMFVFGK